MNVRSEITIYEMDDKEAAASVKPLVVESHWNRRSLVVLTTPQGLKLTVSAAELHRAIGAVQNAHA